MKIQIYINERPVEEFSQTELDEIKKTLTETVMRAVGCKKDEKRNQIQTKASRAG